MDKKQVVLIPLNGTVCCFVNAYLNWAHTTVSSPEQVSSYEVIMETASFLPYFEALVREVIKEEYMSTILEDEPESDKILRELGIPMEVAMGLKNEALNTIVALIYGFLPDVRISDMQAWDYGISEGWVLNLFVPKEQPL